MEQGAHKSSRSEGILCLVTPYIFCNLIARALLVRNTIVTIGSMGVSYPRKCL